ncbi:hypothetical protein [Methyloceanibacter caenitepidi]|uniref:Uncharacterized protein n=1 Tax=Methyloceanibacter caenitepidi TaxID=1384459 RepID=A0A0A8K2A2_9HYPH|nr:hypothetical protein [Methyloceanibacter caenitepidi]BAQ16866.1 hypothetical protein GL4_1409 [Methyloceanibacter caenitepidi]
MEKLTDRELRSALFKADLSARKRSYARELLRRRYDSKGKHAWRKLWVGTLYWLGSCRAALSRRLSGAR